jgi:hypothetical protein
MRAATRKGILFAVLAAIVAYLAIDSGGERRALRMAQERDPGGQAESAPQAADRTGGRFALPERAPLGKPGADLFGTRSWQPPPPKVAAAPAVPVAPPMPYRFAGKLVQDGKLQIFVAKDDAVLPIRVGDTLDGAYRVEAIGEAQITLLYLPLKRKETIPVSSSLPVAASQPGAAQGAQSGTHAPAAVAGAKEIAEPKAVAESKARPKGRAIALEGREALRTAITP